MTRTYKYDLFGGSETTNQVHWDFKLKNTQEIQIVNNGQYVADRSK
jgi:hypothetical protein